MRLQIVRCSGGYRRYVLLAGTVELYSGSIDPRCLQWVSNECRVEYVDEIGYLPVLS